MFVLSSISSGLQFWPLNHTSIKENSEWNFFENEKSFSETSNNWPIDLLETGVYKNLESCWNCSWQYYNGLILPVISIWSPFLPVLYF